MSVYIYVYIYIHTCMYVCVYVCMYRHSNHSRFVFVCACEYNHYTGKCGIGLSEIVLPARGLSWGGVKGFLAQGGVGSRQTV